MMSPASLPRCSTQMYADAAVFGIHICGIQSLLEGDDVFEGNSFEDSHDQIDGIHGYNGEPIIVMPDVGPAHCQYGFC